MRTNLENLVLIDSQGIPQSSNFRYPASIFLENGEIQEDFAHMIR